MVNFDVQKETKKVIASTAKNNNTDGTKKASSKKKMYQYQETLNAARGRGKIEVVSNQI